MNLGTRYVPCCQTRGRPHVMLDSLPIEGTSIVLSHWPGARNPMPVRSDTSTGLVFDFLRAGGDLSGVGACTAVHFDVDGLASLHVALQQPDAREEPFWRALATAGDFRVARSGVARRAVYALEACAGTAVSEWAGIALSERTGRLYGYMLDWLLHRGDALIADAPCAAAVAGERNHRHCVNLLDSPQVHVTLHADVDLACVDIGPALPDTLADWLKPGLAPYFGLDEFAVHQRCQALNVLLSWKGRHVLVQRYEGWVQGASCARVQRRDLSPLREHLQRTDPGASWRYGGVFQPFAWLSSEPGSTSALSPARLADLTATYLRIAPIGWRPHSLSVSEPPHPRPARTSEGSAPC